MFKMNGGNARINGGTFDCACDAIITFENASPSGQIYINGGTFKNTGKYIVYTEDKECKVFVGYEGTVVPSFEYFEFFIYAKVGGGFNYTIQNTYRIYQGDFRCTGLNETSFTRYISNEFGWIEQLLPEDCNKKADGKLYTSGSNDSQTNYAYEHGYYYKRLLFLAAAPDAGT